VLAGKEDVIDLIFRVTQSEQSLPWTLTELMDAEVLISPEMLPTRWNIPEYRGYTGANGMVFSKESHWRVSKRQCHIPQNLNLQ